MSENQTAQMNLREPDRTDWDNYNTGGSAYSAPPPALGPDGKPIVYRGTVGEAKETAPDEELLNYLLDPIRITDAAYAGKEIRFTRASVKPFKRKGEPMKGNPSKLGNFLRSAGLQAKPQTNSEWRAAVAAAKSKPISFTIDWEAYNKDTGESVKGYLSFPEDPERPGSAEVDPQERRHDHRARCEGQRHGDADGGERGPLRQRTPALLRRCHAAGGEVMQRPAACCGGPTG